MNILFISNYRDSHSGWGQAGRDYAKALATTDLNVAIRPLLIGNNRENIVDEDILRLEETRLKPDVVIQHALPHMMDYNSEAGKNIGLFASETDGFRGANWVQRLNLMDEVWVINSYQKADCISSGVKVPIKVVPHAVDISKYSKSYEKPPIPMINGENFVFYYIGEFNRRKNVGAIVKAFHAAFRPGEPVELLLKTNGDVSKLKDYCNEIRNGLKLYSNPNYYKPEILITQHLTDDQIMGIHSHCDCFVSASHGEAFQIPAMDALGFGKPVICTANTGPCDFVWNSHNGYHIESKKERCFGAFDTFNELYTGFDFWEEPSVQSLSECMRKMYDSKMDYDRFKEKAFNTPLEYSYEKIGRLINETLSTV